MEPFLTEFLFVQVVCGQDHSLFRTKKGSVYACGWGADGQTGRNSAQLAFQGIDENSKLS